MFNINTIIEKKYNMIKKECVMYKFMYIHIVCIDIIYINHQLWKNIYVLKI